MSGSPTTHVPGPRRPGHEGDDRLDTRALRNAFGTFMTGVTVVAALDARGTPVGFTANSYASVSLDPPLLLVCPARSLSSFGVFNTCSRFAVSVLAEDQQDISNTFATAGSERFATVAWHEDAWRCPIIDGAAASFSCAVHSRVEAGNHVILVGHIDAFDTSGSAGLGYCNGGYFSLGMEHRAQQLPRFAQGVSVGAIIEHQGQVLMQDTPRGLRPPQVASRGRVGVRSAIEEFLAGAGLRAELGNVYSIFEDRHSGEMLTYYLASAADDDPRGLGRYIEVDELATSTLASRPIAGMFRRYLLERRHGLFGLYVGDDSEGEVHMFGEPDGG